MKLYADTQEAVQGYADRAHAYLVAHDVQYAASVDAGLTVRWDVPHQDSDGWYINVDGRCLEGFTVDELVRLVDSGGA